MSGPARSMMAPCSRPSTPLRAADCGGLRPALTAAVRGALRGSGRDGETALSRTKKHHCSCGPAILQNLTHVTPAKRLDTLPIPRSPGYVITWWLKNKESHDA